METRHFTEWAAKSHAHRVLRESTLETSSSYVVEGYYSAAP